MSQYEKYTLTGLIVSYIVTIALWVISYVIHYVDLAEATALFSFPWVLIFYKEYKDEYAQHH